MIFQLTKFLKIIRWKNLSIYLILEILLYFVLFEKKFNIKDGWLFLVLSMLFFSIFGNIQNNILDYDLDKYKQKFTDFNRKAYLFWSFIFGFLGSFLGLMAFCITLNSQIFYTIFIVPFSIIIYNYYLKRCPLLGNILIAIAISLAIYIPIALSKGFDTTNQYFRFLLIMSTLLNLLRELAKDMEDAQVDKKFNFKTLPVINLKLSKNLLLVLSLVTWLVMFSYLDIFKDVYFYSLLIISFLILSYSLIKVYKDEFEPATKALKLLMLIGIFSIFFI